MGVFLVAQEKSRLTRSCAASSVRELTLTTGAFVNQKNIIYLAGMQEVGQLVNKRSRPRNFSGQHGTIKYSETHMSPKYAAECIPSTPVSVSGNRILLGVGGPQPRGSLDRGSF